MRGPLADIIPLEMTNRLKCCLAAPAARTDEDEIIRHFVEDLFKYEYLLLTKPRNPAQYQALFNQQPNVKEAKKRKMMRDDDLANERSWNLKINHADIVEHVVLPTSLPT